jgi:D-alanyl-lipoteichoic acid acyltransferase DltB (MBOAT superfamily)
MVFSDPLFLAGFLPASLLIFYAVRTWAGGTAAAWTLLGLSMVFYAYWSVPFLGLLLFQIGVNYAAGYRIQTAPHRALLPLAVVFNLALLGYFKYRNFFLENVGDLIGVQFYLTALVVPLGISFHTFQQIAMLVDIKNAQEKLPPFLNYVLFVLFFPQLIAGPIVLHREMGKQLADLRGGFQSGLEFFTPGVVIFAFGLFKKVCLADNIAHYADLAFKPNLPLMMPEAWAGAIAYMLQLFFDFSGYSEMAVGLGLMFGFKLPNNFLVPYTATSMTEFWKRWHITMTRFFTTYVYMRLWMKFRRWLRRSEYWKKHPGPVVEFGVTVAVPMLITFFLSGLWHGAGWTFICFGLVNGVGLVISQAWITARMPSLPSLVGWALTMVTVLVGLVYFRSNDLAQAHYILHQMFMPSEPLLSIPRWLAEALPFDLPISTFTLFDGPMSSAYCLFWIVVLACLAVLLPPLAAAPEALAPSWRSAFATAAMIWLIAGLIGEPRTFLYFAF